MGVDWTYQWQHEKDPIEDRIRPKFNIGDKVYWDNERVTIKRVGRTAKNTFTYDIEEYPWTFAFEYELEEVG